MLTDQASPFFAFPPACLALVTSRHGGAHNVMAAAWHTTLSSDPPLYGVQIAPTRASYELVRQSGRFGLNFLPLSHAPQGHGSGKLSMHTTPEKLQRLGLHPLPEEPLALAEAFLFYGCEVQDIVSTGDHALFVGRVVGVRYDRSAYAPGGALGIQPSLYLGGRRYAGVGDTLDVGPKLEELLQD